MTLRRERAAPATERAALRAAAGASTPAAWAPACTTDEANGTADPAALRAAPATLVAAERAAPATRPPPRTGGAAWAGAGAGSPQTVSRAS